MAQTKSRKFKLEDHDLFKEIDKHITGFEEEVMDGVFVTYGIYDPSTNSPFYVGQSRRFGKRMIAHMRRGARPRRRSETRTSNRMHDIFGSGLVPHFRVLEVVSDKLKSLESETKWIRSFQAEGHDIYVAWKEHRQRANNEGVPQKRYLGFSVAEALAADVRVVAKCQNCAETKPVDLKGIADRGGGSARLGHVKAVLTCGNCRSAISLEFVTPDETRT